MCSAALRDPCATPWLRSVDDESDDGDDWIKCWSSQAATRERHARRRRRAPHHSGHVGKIPVKLLILVLSALLLLLPQNNSYRDLNKNGRMDVYENSNAAIDARVEDLLSQMTLEEKTCQTATLYGYKRVLQDELEKRDLERRYRQHRRAPQRLGPGRQKRLRHRRREARMGHERNPTLLYR